MAVLLHPLRLRRMADSVVVCTTGDVRVLPEAPLPPGCVFREMDMEDGADVRRWLTVHNDAFGRSWGLDHYRRAILEHPHYMVLLTFLVENEGRAVAATSAGFFTRNPQVGTGHYGAVMRSHWRQGIGRALSVLRYTALRELGITHCDVETTIGRSPSIQLQFGLGFRPKLELEFWNTPDSASALMRRIANARLERLYRRWSERQVSRAAGH